MIAILVGAALGFLSGLGIGGGSLLMLWLTQIQHTDPATARGINLLFFLPTALIAATFRWKQGSLPLKKILPAVFAGTVSAFLFAALSTGLDVAILKKLFGSLLIITGIRELCYKPKNKWAGH